MASVTANKANGESLALWRQPLSLWILSATFALSMWGFANLVSSLTLYLKQMGYSTVQSYDIYSAFAALLWVIPMLGGYVSQHIGYWLCSMCGLVLTFVAMMWMWWHPGHSITAGLTLYLVGNGLFTPALWCLVDHLYPKTGEARRMGFTLFYVSFNFGGVLGIFVGGFLASSGHGYNFLVNAILCVFAMILLTFSRKTLAKDLVRKIRPALPLNTGNRLMFLGIIAYFLIYTVSYLIDEPLMSHIFLAVCTALGIGLLAYLANKQKDVAWHHRVIGFCLVGFAAFLFWSLYNLEPSLLSVFAQKYVQRHVAGIEVPATVFFGFACLSAIVIGLLLNKFWQFCAARNIAIGLLARVGIGLFMMGLGYLYLVFAVNVEHYRLIPMAMFAACYVFFTCGELFIGPLGISMAGELSPPGHEGLFMGMWQLIIGLSAVLSDDLAQMSLPHATNSFVAGITSYKVFFMWVGIASLVIAVAIYVFSLWFDKWMENLGAVDDLESIEESPSIA